MSACAILLSYKRPQNMEAIVAEVCSSERFEKVILSNNNPEIDLRKWFDPAKYPIELIDQPVRTSAAKRFEIALALPHTYYFCPDDDVILTAEQINYLMDALEELPGVPHGIYGQLCQEITDEHVTFQNHVYDMTGFVDVLNRCYAFTHRHMERLHELLGLLGLSDFEQAGIFEDVLLSFSGDGKPVCHDVGFFTSCPTSGDPEIATWNRPGFVETRSSVYRRLVGLTNISGQ